ncbi:dihydrolipoyl dehydrogenase [Paenibacillus radicis (ex Xue et al. 2023)]|uniref:Dihydrolipoyl dehydrogenase n=1 Tax=Paenibacillus radicis (ex Xue et al. 2023) TaxID=2972489 RepID=A0ABT1YNB2_9BACL|nr:dihydrolipoyl dehydrogenase [Paenibacillus radicis (ex Xue et al. 2023)]MCR8633884.1 dihydrolipoyl dehydrogenase [Paenibacillus radicis (ex Xue et al. 2023)]
MTQAFDIVILGGGTGGYIAAVRAAQLGKTVAIVEREKLGGTCLHRGCIPSKALLRSAEVYATMLASDKYGIEASSVQLNFPKVQSRKLDIVEQLHKGVQYLMSKHKIQVFYGNGRIIGPSIFSPRSGVVSVEQDDGEIITLTPDKLIIATGSRPRQLPGLNVDGSFIISSDEALELEALPSSIIIVGGGVIGVEWASMLSDFGVKVTVIEYAPRLLPTEDADISKEMERILKKRGVQVLTDARVIAEDTRVEAGQVTVQVERKGEQQQLHADKVLVSVGRQANVEGIGLEGTDIKLDKGAIRVNEFMQTTESHIYAIGDVNGGLQLAHVAGHEGIIAVEHASGLKPHTFGAHQVPRCIYTRPEAASIGWTQQQAIERGHEVKVGRFPFSALGKALINGDSDGFVKVIADKQTNDILGVHMIGTHVTDYISEAALAQVLDATPWEVGQTIHPHPTLSEALGEAMLAVDGRAIGI